MSLNDKIIDYGQLVDEAMYFIVYKALKMVEQYGIIGDHHFLISFLTKYKGVILSERLCRQYPDEMMIVLQHQFLDLVVHREYFEVALSFGGIIEKISVPFSAVTTFADPSVQFCLEFSAASNFDQILGMPSAKANNNIQLKDHSLNTALAIKSLQENTETHLQHNGKADSKDNLMSNVFSLDEFRRRKNKKN